MDITHRRIERARHQYETLLIHAGDVLLDQPSSRDQYDDEEQQDAPYLLSSAPRNTYNSKWLEEGNNSVYYNGTIYKRSPSSQTDQDIIASLQSENDRLRLKLDSTINYASDMVQAAQISQTNLMDTLTAQDGALIRKNTALIEENKQLNVILQLTQKELQSEREKLFKATRFMERLKGRERVTKSSGSIRRDSGGSINVQSIAAAYATSSLSPPVSIPYTTRRNSNSPNGMRSPLAASLNGSSTKKLATSGHTRTREHSMNTIGSLSQSPYKSPYKSPSPLKSPYKSSFRSF
jgi:hypothetical protein